MQNECSEVGHDCERNAVAVYLRTAFLRTRFPCTSMFCRFCPCLGISSIIGCTASTTIVGAVARLLQLGGSKSVMLLWNCGTSKAMEIFARPSVRMHVQTCLDSRSALAGRTTGRQVTSNTSRSHTTPFVSRGFPDLTQTHAASPSATRIAAEHPREGQSPRCERAPHVLLRDVRACKQTNH